MMTSVSVVDWKRQPLRTSVRRSSVRVGQVAVVGEREAAEGEIGEQRLDVAQDRAAGGGVAVMADRGVARQPSITSASPKLSPTRPSGAWLWKCWPSKLTMPAASWPRCCRACRPSAVSAAASGTSQTPKTPHSSWNLSSSRRGRGHVDYSPAI